MISLILATLVASPTFTYTVQAGTREVPHTVVVNNNYPSYAYRYEVDEFLMGAQTTQYFQLDMDGNIFNFAIHNEFDLSDGYLTTQWYFATVDAYQSTICFNNVSMQFIDDDSGDSLFTDVIGLPSVYFTQSNSIYRENNPYIEGYDYFYMDYDDDYFYIEKAYSGSLIGSEISLTLSFDIELMPVNFVNGEEYQTGYTDGWNNGNDHGFDDGYRNGYSDGASDAWEEASQQDGTAMTIFSGIVTVGLLPINFFLGILNFEVFGINIGGLVAGFLTIAIVIIIVRIIFAGGNGSSGGSK